MPEFVTPVGRAVGVPYNGSVARVAFGPVAYARVRRWLVGHRFDVLHLHKPTTASVSAIALLLAEGPVVATFHTATERSRALAALGGFIQPLMEKVTARIAVSPSARRVQVRHLGGDAVEIPNGVDVAALAPTGPRSSDTVAFVGRFDEPRKGMPVLLDALARLRRPDLRLVVVGRGDPAGLPPSALRYSADAVPLRYRSPRPSRGRSLSPLATGAGRLEMLGAVDDARKAAVLGAATVFCAPHIGGESFGIVLTEALAAGAPVLASDLDAFRAVLGGLAAGALFRAGDPAARPRRSARCSTTRRDGPRSGRRARACGGVRLVAGGGRRRTGLPGGGRGRPPAVGVVTALGVLFGLVAAAWAVALCLGRVRRLHRLTSASTRPARGLTRRWPAGRWPRRRRVSSCPGPAHDTSASGAGRQRPGRRRGPP